jgi:phosphotriesterase-related protein
VTLPHEHLYSDMTSLLRVHGYAAGEEARLGPAEARWNPGAFPDNYRLVDVETTVAELEPVAAAGCRTVVDTTPVGLGRSPQHLREIAARTGLNVVMGCGWYLEGTHPADVATRDADALAAQIVAEVRNGVAGTGIRPGIIGEIGTGAEWSAAEEKVLRAAARAQRETGLCVTVHLHPWSQNGERVLDVLRDEGVPPGRTILNHMTTAIHDERYQLALLERGAFLAYDLFGFDHSLLGLGRYPPSDFDVARGVVDLVERGFVAQLLLSQDVGVKTRLRRYGGWGYAHLFEHVVPLLRELGLGAPEVDTLLVDNPRRALEV